MDTALNYQREVRGALAQSFVQGSAVDGTD